MHKVYSKRLGTISNAQIQQALDRFDLGTLISTDTITEGHFGQNFFISSESGEYVFRGVPHHDWQFPLEQFFAEKLHEHTTAPVPYPYIMDTTTDIFGWSYVIMPRMLGINITHAQLRDHYNTHDQEGIIAALAANLVAMQQLTWEYPGHYDPQTDTIQPFSNGYIAEVLRRLHLRLTRAMELNNQTTSDDLAWAMQTVEHVLNKSDITHGTFVMQDYKLENTVLANRDGHWRVNGVFDLMESYIGFGESDLARTYALLTDHALPHLAKLFVKTYADLLRKEYAEISNRVIAFLIMDRAIVWESRQRNNTMHNHTITFREWVEGYL